MQSSTRRRIVRRPVLDSRYAGPGTRASRRIRIAAGVVAVIALAAAVIFGLHRASVAQGTPAISLEAPVSFPVDI